MVRLCSLSPTRAKLLTNFNIEYIQSPIGFDESSIKKESPKDFVYFVAKGKLNSALREYDLTTPIVVADSVVTANGKILRKAKSRDDAKRLLLEQSGNSVSIITATILKSQKLEFIDISSTKFIFDEFNSLDLEEYLDSKEWQGKAGACMVEGFCKKYIKSIDGLESCAMGLPVEKLLPWLEF